MLPVNRYEQDLDVRLELWSKIHITVRLGLKNGEFVLHLFVYYYCANKELFFFCFLIHRGWSLGSIERTGVYSRAMVILRTSIEFDANIFKPGSVSESISLPLASPCIHR